MQVNLRERGLYRWGSVMFPKRREDDFPLQDLRLAKENIAAMLDRTLTELNMPGGRFTDVIIGRHNAEKSRARGPPSRSVPRRMASGQAMSSLKLTVRW